MRHTWTPVGVVVTGADPHSMWNVDTVAGMSWMIVLVAALAVLVILGCLWEAMIRGRHRRPRTP